MSLPATFEISISTIFTYILYFFFYSAAGWAFESTYCSIGERKIINRGFLFGPMCPIYGTGTLVMEIMIYPFRDKPLVVFILGMIFCDVVEYLTSLIMEKLFNTRWWDYKNELFNIKGRICIKHTLYWGMASVAFIKFIHPNVESLFKTIFGNLPDKAPTIAVIVILCIFITDLFFSVLRASDMFNLLVKVSELIDSTSNGKKIIEEKYSLFRMSLFERFNLLRFVVSEKFDELSNILDEGNDNINISRQKILAEAKDRLESFEKKILFSTFSKTELIEKRKKIKKEFRLKNLSEEIKDIIEELKNRSQQ